MQKKKLKNNFCDTLKQREVILKHPDFTLAEFQEFSSGQYSSLDSWRMFPENTIERCLMTCSWKYTELKMTDLFAFDTRIIFPSLAGLTMRFLQPCCFFRFIIGLKIKLKTIKPWGHTTWASSLLISVSLLQKEYIVQK